MIAMKIEGKYYVMILLFFSGLLFLFSNKVNAQEGTSFIIPIEVKAFSPKAILKVRLWNAKQLEMSQKTSHCTTSYNMQTKTEEISCPDGIKYQKPSLEEFSFPVEDIDSSIEIASGTLQIGEAYRLQVSGLSNDDCNRTSASVEGETDSKTIQFKNLSWATTMMACL